MGGLIKLPILYFFIWYLLKLYKRN
jgi:hypothetical protein